ncbi:MAG: hypothetical protein HY360_11820 [Verrucomicrobia bacterium]|nr:hypothetical protein [Verrucomicrobiota bacterium]
MSTWKSTSSRSWSVGEGGEIEISRGAVADEDVLDWGVGLERIQNQLFLMPSLEKKS